MIDLASLRAVYAPDPNELRHRVPTHLDEPDGIGGQTVRQLITLTGTALFVAPAIAALVPEGGPALGDLARATLPTIGQMIPPGAVPVLPVLGYGLPMAGAAVISWPVKPPPEHGAICYTKFRAGRGRHQFTPQTLGPKEVDELMGHPRVERDVLHVYDEHVAMWDLPSVSMRLANDDSRNTERARWAAFIDGAPCPVETAVRATKVDLRSMLDGMARSTNPHGPETASWLRASTAAGGEVQRRRVISIRAKDEGQLGRWAMDIESALARATLRAARIEGEDLEDAYHAAWTSKPRRGKRIGPQTIRIEADGLMIDGEWTAFLAFHRWPAAVIVDFLANVYDGVDAIDAIQLITPKDTVAIRKKLENRLFRLKTTTGKRSRSVAIEQLETTLMALEHNDERVHEAVLLFGVRASTRPELADRVRRVKTIVEETGGAEAAFLKWEHTDGLLATSGILENRLVHRAHLVDTSSISRAYPLGASELGLPNAIPWGRTLHGNRRVVWTPFARPMIPNPVLAVYAASGGGKGFAVKVWTARAVLANLLLEAFMIDQAEESPDGEYGRWAQYLQGEVRKLHRHNWESDLAAALADIPDGTLPPAIVLNVAELSQFERCRAFVAFKRAVFRRAANRRAYRTLGMDEMWTYGDDPEASREGEDVARRGRHLLLNGTFMTQRPMDALDTGLGRVVQNSAPSALYGMQMKGEISDVEKRLRWTPQQTRSVQRLGQGEFMLEAGMTTLTFRVDWTPAEFEMAQTDTIGTPVLMTTYSPEEYSENGNTTERSQGHVLPQRSAGHPVDEPRLHDPVPPGRVADLQGWPQDRPGSDGGRRGLRPDRPLDNDEPTVAWA